MCECRHKEKAKKWRAKAQELEADLEALNLENFDLKRKLSDAEGLSLTVDQVIEKYQLEDLKDGAKWLERLAAKEVEVKKLTAEIASLHGTLKTYRERIRDLKKWRNIPTAEEYAAMAQFD